MKTFDDFKKLMLEKAPNGYSLEISEFEEKEKCCHFLLLSHDRKHSRTFVVEYNENNVLEIAEIKGENLIYNFT